MNCLHCSQAQGAFCAALVQGPPGGSGHHACVCWLYTHRRAYLCASIAVIGKDPPENSTKNTSGLLYVVISCVQALCGRSHVRELLAKAGDHQCTSLSYSVLSPPGYQGTLQTAISSPTTNQTSGAILAVLPINHFG